VNSRGGSISRRLKGIRILVCTPSTQDWSWRLETGRVTNKFSGRGGEDIGFVGLHMGGGGIRKTKDPIPVPHRGRSRGKKHLRGGSALV